MSAKISGVVVAAMVLGGILGTSARADAALITYICDDIQCLGGNDTIVTDQGPGDNFPGSAMVGQVNSGVVVFNGFTIATNITQSKPLIGSAGSPAMDLTFSAVTNDNVSHTIFLYASDTGFTGLGSIALTMGGTQSPGGSGNTVQGRVWGGTSNLNLDFSGANLIANSGVTSATPFAATAFGNLSPGVNPYSLTMGVTLTRSTAGTTTGDLNVSQVPEPASITLLGTGLFVLGRKLRRRNTSV